MEEFYNMKQAAEKLNSSERQIRAFINNGEIKAVKKIGKLYIMHSDLVAFIQTGKNK